jgi:hypothetical protein
MTDEVPTSRPLQQRVGNQLDGWSRPCSIGIHCTSDDSASGSPRFSIGSITKSKATFCRSSCGRSDRELTRRSVTTRPAQPVSPKVREGRRPPLSRRGPESRQAAPISRLRRDAARASRVTASVPLNDGMHHHVPEAGTPPSSNVQVITVIPSAGEILKKRRLRHRSTGDGQHRVARMPFSRATSNPRHRHTKHGKARCR